MSIIPIHLLRMKLPAMLILLASQATVGESHTLYVATNGDNGWSGLLDAPNDASTDGPLATVEGARDLLRHMRNHGEITGPVLVLIRGGSYMVDEPLVFGPVDSGTEAAPITYANYPGERPVLHGGYKITDWTVGDNIWTTNLPPDADGQWPTTSLWVNGERRTPARTPNAVHEAGDFPSDNEFFFAGGQLTEPDGEGVQIPSTRRFKFRTGDLQEWESLPDAHAVVYHAWSTSLLPIESLDMTEDVVTFTGPSRYAFGRWRQDQWYYIENLREGLDIPGEWYINRRNGTLHYYPLAGETPANTEVVVPVVEELLRLAGDQENYRYVEWVNFRGIQFSYTNFSLPAEGISDSQAAARVDAMVRVSATRNCTFHSCIFTHVGNTALWLRTGSQDNRIEICEFSDLGAGAVKIGEVNGAPSPSREVIRNTVDNCYLNDGGRLIREAVGVWIGRSSENRITHNDISDFRYSGISVGWKWGYDGTTAHDNLIEDNHVHHIGNGQLNDMGGIYTLGESPGTVIRRNHIHDIRSNPKLYGGWGIYLDEGSSDILIENNVVYSTETGAFHQHYGQNNLIKNNVFAFSHGAQLERTLNEPGNSFRFTHNIVYFNNGTLLGGKWDDNNFEFDYNLYWDTSRRPLDFDGRTWQEWQDSGMDLNSMVVEPAFVAPTRANFGFSPFSPALSLGIKPVHLSETGLYGEAAWTSRPAQVQRDGFRPPDFATINEDFETTAQGSLAQNAVTRGEEGGASARVTDEIARSGQRCLKLVDREGLSRHFYPYVNYSPILRDGMAHGSVSLRFTPGSVLYYEWRDNGEPYRAGPSVWTDVDGNLRVRGIPLMSVPANTWITLDVSCALGDLADGTFDLTVTVDGEAPRTFEGLECVDPAFDQLDWVGIASDADADQVIYIDDVYLTQDLPKGTALPVAWWPAATAILLACCAAPKSWWARYCPAA